MCPLISTFAVHENTQEGVTETHTHTTPGLTHTLLFIWA